MPSKEGTNSNLEHPLLASGKFQHEISYSKRLHKLILGSGTKIKTDLLQWWNNWYDFSQLQGYSRWLLRRADPLCWDSRGRWTCSRSRQRPWRCCGQASNSRPPTWWTSCRWRKPSRFKSKQSFNYKLFKFLILRTSACSLKRSILNWLFKLGTSNQVLLQKHFLKLYV